VDSSTSIVNVLLLPRKITRMTSGAGNRRGKDYSGADNGELGAREVKAAAASTRRAAWLCGRSDFCHRGKAIWGQT
jgi:hypothetical protein